MRVTVKMNSLNGLTAGVQVLRDEIEVLFKNPPSNPAASPVGKNAFRMKQSDMVNGIIHPDYYDFSCQHKEFVDMIQTYPIEKLEEKLQEVLKKGKFNRKGYRFPIHPTMLEFFRDRAGYNQESN